MLNDARLITKKVNRKNKEKGTVITDLDNNSYYEIVKSSSKPVLVDFWAPWCGPCLRISPVLESISLKMESELIFVKINVDTYGSIASENEIVSIPALIIFDKGKPIGRVKIGSGFGEERLTISIRETLAMIDEKTQGDIEDDSDKSK